MTLRRLSFAIAMLAIGLSASAMPVNPGLARLAGTNFLRQKGLLKAGDTLSCYKSIGLGDRQSGSHAECLYVFNVEDRGYVLVSADDRCVPILGYSMNGAWDDSRMAGNALSWVQGYAESIYAGIRAGAPASSEASAQWEKLFADSYPASSPKSDSYLLTSTWEQGDGYNEFCPVFRGDHVVVGCVATAMSQIIRYHRYPSRGFGRAVYNHPAYGMQKVDFDTSEYDYTLMPDHLDYHSTEAQRFMVSRLCYHCGVSVHMQYEWAEHTSGSGAHSNDVPAAFKHFGYLQCQYYDRTQFPVDADWMNLIRSEIDLQRPVYYSGSNVSAGGHAFVCDGYDSGNRFHFNFGWGGYADGFYTLTTMQGFTETNAIVTHIIPSGVDAHGERFYVSSDGQGNSCDWDHAAALTNDILTLASFTGRDIWMKQGVYYGDTSSVFAFDMSGGFAVYGGFAGTERSLDERVLSAQNPTILDGQNRRPVLRAHYSANTDSKLYLHDLVIQNGRSDSESSLTLNGSSVLADNIVVRHCAGDSAAAVRIASSRLRYAEIYGNATPASVALDNGTLRQSLVRHNDGGLLFESDARVLGCDIVSNRGTGVRFATPEGSLCNTIVWNNDASLQFDSIGDTAVRYCAIQADQPVAGDGNVQLSLDTPIFIAQSGQRGSFADGQGEPQDDFHLAQGSVCVDAGCNARDAFQDSDLDGKFRSRNGRMDIGCYESKYPPASVSQAEPGQVSVYPNPANEALTVEGGVAARVELFDLSGRRVAAAEHFAERASIDLAGVASGIYVLKVFRKDGQVSVTRVVKR